MMKLNVYFRRVGCVFLKDYIDNDPHKIDQFDRLTTFISPFNRNHNSSTVSTIKLSFQVLLRSINVQSTLCNSIISCKSFLLKSPYGDQFPLLPA